MNQTLWHLQLLNYIYPPVFLVIGVSGNILSMLIWIKRIRTSPGSTCLFLALMCGTDTYVLFHGCMRHWLKSLMVGFDIRTILDCKFPLTIFTFFSDLSVWLIVLLCIERSVCVFSPVNAKQICRLRNGGLAFLFTVFCLMVVNSHFILTVKVSETRDHCMATNEMAQHFHKAWPYIDFALYSLIPLLFIFVLNSLILIKLHRTHSRFNRSKQSNIGRIFWTVLLMAIAHFVFTMPIGIYFLIPEEHCTNAEWVCEIMSNMFTLLQQTNHLMHFFIYSITSTLFITDLKRMFPWLYKFKFFRKRINTSRSKSKAVMDEFECRIKPEPKPEITKLMNISNCIDSKTLEINMQLTSL